MKFVKYLYIGCVCIVFIIAHHSLPKLLFNSNSNVTSFFQSKGKLSSVISKRNFKQCRAMYTKSDTKRLQNKRKKSRSPPFWFTGEVKENNLFVTNVGNGGRLGNKLFEFASVFGVAYSNNRTPILRRDTLATINRYFDTRIAVNNSTDSTSNVVTFNEEECHTRMPVTKQLPKKNVSIGLYLISRLYFDDAQEELRKELTFKDSVLDVARKYLNVSASPEGETSFARVVIHERRGDLLSELRRISGFLDLTSDYYLQSMTYFRQCYDRVQFVVISDDIEWCKKKIVGPDVIYSEGHSPAEDLAIGSLCDHAIITRGTFSIWTGWFANGITIRPLKGAKPNTAAFEKHKQEMDTYPYDNVLI